MLEIKNLYKTYPGVEVGPFSIQMSTSQIISVIGKSGTGKSTFVRMITGVLNNDSGNISFKQDRLKVTDYIYISQSGSLFNGLTVKENLKLTFKGDDSTIVQSLKEVYLDESFLDKYPRELNTDERQRIDLVRAIMSNAKIMILDETLNSLDSKKKNNIHKALTNITKLYGLLVIIVTNDIEEAIKLSHSILLLDQGKINFHGTGHELLKSDNHNFNKLVGSRKLKKIKKNLIND